MSTQHLALVHHSVPLLEINTPVESIWDRFALIPSSVREHHLRLVRLLKAVEIPVIRGLPVLEIVGNSRGVLWGHTK